MRMAFGPTIRRVLAPKKSQKKTLREARVTRSKQALCHPGAVPIHTDFRRDPADRGVMLNASGNYFGILPNWNFALAIGRQTSYDSPTRMRSILI
ncbi:hypothetical protein [Burkholderia sp. SRS-W-2-2016]|uniref:hypothetical protein n=1 Tax=Burkholderia sp. SRS-W-2-2016 TaxID=1926878 RepID=UPI00117C0736|nr:hypothetical protein [Burkholderia sp. SRS-W-2-2016]